MSEMIDMFRALRQRRKADNLARRVKNKIKLVDLRKEGYEVVKIADFQYRINGYLDIYVVNSKWHDIRTQERGQVNNIYNFVKKYVK